ncbi:hypothetical protein SDJN02_06598, partial [Cucurbita argyrosperma subsp. argyrosperma]
MALLWVQALMALFWASPKSTTSFLTPYLFRASDIYPPAPRSPPCFRPIPHLTNIGDQISLNNVTVDKPPLYDDGSLIIFGIEKFFNPFFESWDVYTKRIIRPDLDCRSSSIQSDPIGPLAAVLRNRGLSVMVSFLELQFLGFHKQPALTIFAPPDEFSDGTEVRTYLRGFGINVNRSGGVLMVNNMSVIFPDMFYSERIVVHGIGGILEMQKKTKRSEMGMQVKATQIKL